MRLGSDVGTRAGQSGVELAGQIGGRPGFDQPVREERPQRPAEITVPNADPWKGTLKVVESLVDVEIQLQASDWTRGQRWHGR
ncbi:hypothetical protein HUX53_18070 [Actinomadura sp. BRA 177]|nr:hypothetical protein [Actinomadura sp. BRA 177]